MKHLIFLSSLSFCLVVQAKPFKMVLSYPESVVKADGDSKKLLKSEVYLQIRYLGEVKNSTGGTIPSYEIISPQVGTIERKLLDNFFELGDANRRHNKDIFGMTMTSLWQTCNSDSAEATLDLNFGSSRAISSLEQRKAKGLPIEDPGLISYSLNGCHAKLDSCEGAHNLYKSSAATDEEKADAWSKMMKETDAALLASCCLNKRMNYVAEEGRWKVSTRGMIDIAAFYQKLEKCEAGLWSINGSLKRNLEKTPTEVPEKHTASADK